MKLRLLILLAAALAAAPAAGQTIKSLGYNTTNGQVVYSGTNTLTFTNTPHFTNTIRLGVFGSGSDRGFVGRNSGGNFALYGTNVTSSQPSFYGFDGTANTAFSAGTSRTNLGLGASNNVVFKELTLNGAGLLVNESGFFSLTVTTNFGGINFVNGTTPMFTLTGSLATFATNVTVNGNLSVGSLTTTTPSTWALDATQTAAAINGRLALPSNANVIRLTNNNAISSVTNGVLGAFYYIVNQATNAVTISNVGGITIDGAQNLTLSPNESATLVATGPTNVSVAARGDLNDVTLGGTLNIAPAQTTNSADSLMTRSLSDTRYGEWISQTEMGQLEFTTATTTQTTLGGSYQSPNTNILSGAAVRMYGFTNSGDYNVLNVVASSLMWLSSGGVAQQASGIGLFVRANASIGTNRVARIVYGGVSSNQVAGIVGTNGLDRRGFALEIAPITSATNNLRLIAQDGTNGIVASAWIPVSSGAGLTGATYFMAHSNGTTRVYYGTDNARPSRTPVVTLNHVLAAGAGPGQPVGILFSVVNTNSDTAAGNLFIRAAWQMINADLVGY